MPFDRDRTFYEAARPITVDGGLAVRSKRGSIGEQWWSRRFVDVLEGICDPGRLTRGRAYARKGQVIDFALTPGQVVARVQGSRPEPYRVTVRMAAFDDAAWEEIIEALGSRALYRAALLAGEMPHEIVELFADLGLPLFPSELGIDCSCPDWGVPCKHGSAALYVLAEAFDDDPFLVLAWRGRDRDVLLDALRGTAESEEAFDPLAVDEEPLDSRLADFYSPAISLGRLRERPARVSAPPELLIRALDPPKVSVRHIPLIDLLRPVYRDLGTPPEEA
ncbi:SWIM zinc finger family protein [Actinoplanes sp. NPDC051851]|uniref:SWIM zinc finger family protein n=1 Tax=Actinoplanes sp. NPDC051851 TaxID=3154753 RepID=UPI00343D84CC